MAYETFEDVTADLPLFIDYDKEEPRHPSRLKQVASQVRAEDIRAHNLGKPRPVG
jgi:hypothetical protein